MLILINWKPDRGWRFWLGVTAQSFSAVVYLILVYGYSNSADCFTTLVRVKGAFRKAAYYSVGYNSYSKWAELITYMRRLTEFKCSLLETDLIPTDKVTGQIFSNSEPNRA